MSRPHLAARWPLCPGDHTRLRDHDGLTARRYVDLPHGSTFQGVTREHDPGRLGSAPTPPAPAETPLAFRSPDLRPGSAATRSMRRATGWRTCRRLSPTRCRG